MGVVTRIVDVVNSNISAALDKVEKPEHMLRLVIQELEDALADARSQAAQQIAEKKQLDRTTKNISNQMTDWVSKAEVALSKDREDLAKKALIEKNNLETELTEVSSVLNVVDESLSALQEDINKLNQKLVEAKSKRNSLLKRHEVASTQLKSKQTLNRSGAESMALRYEQFSQKVDQIESKVEAMELSSNPSLQDEFKQLEADSKLEAQLAELKTKVAKA